MLISTEEIFAQIRELIPQLNEEQLVDLFEQEMLEDGYLSNSRRPDDGLWQTAQEWLKNYLDDWNPSKEQLEALFWELQDEIDFFVG